MATIELNNITFTYNKNTPSAVCALDHVSLKIDGAAEVVVGLIPFPGAVIPSGIAAQHLLSRLTEDVDVLPPHALRDFHVRAVHRAQRHRAVEHEFHVAGAAGLLARQTDLLGKIAGGH